MTLQDLPISAGKWNVVMCWRRVITTFSAAEASVTLVTQAAYSAAKHLGQQQSALQYRQWKHRVFNVGSEPETTTWIEPRVGIGFGNTSAFWRRLRGACDFNQGFGSTGPAPNNIGTWRSNNNISIGLSGRQPTGLCAGWNSGTGSDCYSGTNRWHLPRTGVIATRAPGTRYREPEPLYRSMQLSLGILASATLTGFWRAAGTGGWRR